MELRLSDHTRKRMRERRIDEADIEWALKRPTRQTPGEAGTIWIHGYAAGGRILKVCVAVDDHSDIRTVAWPDRRV